MGLRQRFRRTLHALFPCHYCVAPTFHGRRIAPQIMADIMTVKEHIGRYEDVKVRGGALVHVCAGVFRCLSVNRQPGVSFGAA